jgi:hypothetical protein
MNINEQLEELYKNGKQNLDKIPISNENPTNPLLLYVDEQCFKKTKVMLFGQETNDWHGAYSSIKAPLEEMNKYKTFWIDKRSDYSNVGVLMQTFNNLQKDFDDVCFLWNNIIKIGKTGKGTPKDLIEWQKNWFDITKKEIELINPQMMIFFTGHYYDKFIKKTFGEFKQIQIEDFDIKSICQLSFINYPQIVAYRTYHPNYLRRSGLAKKYLPLLKKAIQKLHIKEIQDSMGKKFLKY